MTKTNIRLSVCAAIAVALVGHSALAELMDRPSGIKIGQRMTLKPYVGVSATYTSNADGGRDGNENVYWTVNPGLRLEYKATNWSLDAGAEYSYHAYSKKRANSQNDYHGISQHLIYKWTNAARGERGWTLMLSESYRKTFEDNDYDAGREYGTDRQIFSVAGALERNFGYGIHGDINAGYYWLDYDNNNHSGSRSGLYGWERATVGAEVGWAPSKWLDFLVAGSYSHYDQDNNSGYYSHSGNRPSSHSNGYTLQGGFGSYATDHISYRLLAGWSRFEYGGGTHGRTANGFTYSASANWTITSTWKTMLLATSFYQPTERDYGGSQRVDALSWGLAHSMVRGKLNSTFDISYRHETPKYVWSNGAGQESGSDYTIDYLHFRLGLNYVLNRYLTFFGNFSYRMSVGGGNNDARADNYTYNCFMATLGLRFTY